jgi:hypothetical protein
MANSKTVNTVFGYAVDQASLARVTTTIRALKKEQQDLINAFRALPAGDSGLSALSVKIDNNRQALRKATAEAEALRKKLKEVNDTPVAPSISIPRAPGGGASVLSAQSAIDDGRNRQTNAISAFGRELRMLPSTPIPGTGLATDAIGNLLRVTGPVLTALTGSLTAVLTAALPVTAALGALAATVIIFGQRSEEGAKVIRGVIAAQEKYFDLLNTGTRDQVERAIEAARQEQEGLQRRIDTNKRFFQAIDEQLGSQFIGSIARGFADIFNLSGAQELRKDTQDLEQQLLSAGIATGYLTAQLEGAQVAANQVAADVQLLNGGDEGDVFEADINRRIDLAQQLAGLNEDNAEAQLKAFEERRNNLNAEFNTLTNYKGLFEFLAENTSGPLRDAALGFLGRLGEVETELNDLNYTLIPAAEGTKELAEAADALAEASKRALVALEAQIARDTRANQLLRTGTVEQVDERIASLRDEASAIMSNIGALQLQAATNEDAKKKLDEYNTRLTEINTEIGQFNQLRPDVAVRQFREESAKLLDEFTADIAKIEQARDDRIAQIQADRTDKETAAYTERDEAVLEIQRKTREDEREQAEKHQKALAKIVAKGNAAIANAVASRDALAAFLAVQSKNEQIKEENEANADRLAEIKKRSDEEYRVTNKRLTDTLNAARAAADKAVRLERAKADAEIATRRAQYTAEFQALVQVVNGHASAWNSITSYAQQAVNFIQRLTGQAQTQFRQVIQPQTVTLTGGSAASRFAEYQRSQGIPGFAAGGFPPVGRPVLVGENGPELVTFNRPARVYNNRETRQMGAGGGINIGPIYGSNKAEILREVAVKLGKQLDRVM